MTISLILLSILGNFFIGCVVAAALDTKDRIFFNWYKGDPTGGIICFIVVSFWPIMAFLMLRYKYIQRRINDNETN